MSPQFTHELAIADRDRGFFLRCMRRLVSPVESVTASHDDRSSSAH